MKQDDFKTRLDVCFRGYAKVPSLCMESSFEAKFYVDDDKDLGYCIIIFPDPQIDPIKMFKVKNPDSKEIVLWRIDGCFLRKSPNKRCDCILFDDASFCFIEFKTNAYTIEPEIIETHRAKAIDQLEKTVQLVDNTLATKGLDYMGFLKEAYLCTPVAYPNKGTAIRSEQIRFLTTYQTELFEKSEKRFV